MLWFNPIIILPIKRTDRLAPEGGTVVLQGEVFLMEEKY